MKKGTERAQDCKNYLKNTKNQVKKSAAAGKIGQKNKKITVNSENKEQNNRKNAKNIVKH